ncbi:MAG: phosphoribosylanthranilate isomerase [Planctomycetes bacterium]|nr:phosphoribosylanthranilate isomerase [Planctomycetota bacterium]MBI3848311.1 phosphoribosylanthranilate isomerase [Planctomycetota bacterium]
MVRVKICGITRADDARAAVDAGADAIGLVFAESPRRVTVDVARTIVATLPPFVVPVGVFTSTPIGEIREVARACRLRAVQVHRVLTPNDVTLLDLLYVLQACRIGSRADAESAARAIGDAVLLDAKAGDAEGGTGKTFDWSLVAGITFGKPIILAGGLTPTNVESAIRAVRPMAVDVSTSVEASPGRKSAPAMLDFVRRAKATH